jgi:hypothetical protein
LIAADIATSRGLFRPEIDSSISDGDNCDGNDVVYESVSKMKKKSYLRLAHMSMIVKRKRKSTE